MMQFKFFTLPLWPSTEQEEELNRFLRGHKVVEVERKLVEGNQGGWSFCICYLHGSGKSTSKYVSPKVDYREVLGDVEFRRYEAMRVHRKAVAQELNIPAYAVFTNNELAELSKKEKLEAKDLLDLGGFGEGRMSKTGDLFLKKLKTGDDVGGAKSH